MGKFIISTFLLLGWGFWIMSGGSDFEPEVQLEAAAPVVVIPEAPVVAEVTRSNTSLSTLNAQVTQASLAVEPVVEDVVATQQITLTAPEPAPVAAPIPLDLRAVAGSRVNMREGPGTGFGVIDTLPGGTEAEVIEVNADGWARIRIIGTNQTGWMAERLLNPI